MTPPLDYASPPATPRRAWYRSPLALGILDGWAAAFLISQLAFLLEMMITNIHECGVPPYWVGSSYQQSALGNNTFVRSFPNLAAWIIRLPRARLEVLACPAFLANAFTLTGFTWVLSAYLVWRAIEARGRRRALILIIALPTIATLPWIYPALMVKFD